VRSGKWKLRHAFQIDGAKDSDRLELFNLEEDIGESRDLAAQHPEVVKRLSEAMTGIRAELGDKRLGIEGSERRPPAICADPRPLTTFNPDFPYIEPAYELDEGG
jgi:hypothetical protein